MNWYPVLIFEEERKNKRKKIRERESRRYNKEEEADTSLI